MTRPSVVTSWIATALLTGGALAAVAAPAQAQVAPPAAVFGGYSTGTDVFASVLRASTTGPQLLDADVAYSGASMASGGLGTQIVNEMGEVVQPANAAKNSFGRGSGIEVGGGTNIPNNSNQIVLPSKEIAWAPPSSTADSNLVTIPAAPIAYAQAARGRAAANWLNDSTCPLFNGPISFGEGYVADAQLLSSSGSSTNPMTDPVLEAEAPGTTSTAPENVSDAKSWTTLANPTTANGVTIKDAPGLGVESETLETIAPVTLFAGTSNQLTIRILGTWEFKAEAGGVPGSAYIQYGPVPGSYNTNILEVDQPGATPQYFTFQQVFGQGGLTIPADPLVHITIGTPPHAIGGADTSKPTINSDGTLASAAVDVANVEVDTQTTNAPLMDIRLGHMEAKAYAPAGGISCPIPGSKTAVPNPVLAGHNFTYDLTVGPNPYGCTLTHVFVTDTITGSTGVKFSIDSTSPTAKSISGDTINWSGNLPDIKPGGSDHLTITVSVPTDSAAGVLTDLMTFGGICGTGTAPGAQGIITPVNLVGKVTYTGPQVNQVGVGALAISRGLLPRTGGNPMLPTAGLLLLAGAGGLFAWRRRRRNALR
jgi:LPXTG-motif cell wall-anchored protein